MGIALKRKKKRNFLLTFLYRFNKLLFFINKNKKLKFFLNLEWIFERLALEESNQIFLFEENPIKSHSLDFIKTRINDNSVVLDMGCKYGDISAIIANIAKEVIGIDYDEIALKIARNKHVNANLTFIKNDAIHYLDQTDKKFNILILSHILEHIDNPVDLLLKAKPHFKLIYIEVPDFDKSYLNQVRLKMNNNLIFSDADHVYEYDRKDFKELLQKCKLKILDEEFRFGVQKYWCSTSYIH